VPSGISVVTVGNAVQIKRNCLSSVATLITCRGYPDTRQVGVRITCKHRTPVSKHVTIYITISCLFPIFYRVCNGEYPYEIYSVALLKYTLVNDDEAVGKYAIEFLNAIRILNHRHFNCITIH
jgi:hypothetical protein